MAAFLAGPGLDSVPKVGRPIFFKFLMGWVFHPAAAIEFALLRDENLGWLCRRGGTAPRVMNFRAR